MTEQLISFATATLAKEKGFDIKSNQGFWYNSKYHKDGEEIDWLRPIKDSELLKLRHSNEFEIGNPFVYRPTQSLLQKWLREVHSIYVGSNPIKNGFTKLKLKYEYVIIYKLPDIQEFISSMIDNSIIFNTYEEALEEGLKQTLQLIKNENTLGN